MSPSALSIVALAFAGSALAQIDPADPNPLTAKTYTYSAVPYQVDPVSSAIRGPQVGYNQCNSTTQNQQSLCQTAIINSISDFCLWAPSQPNSTIGDTEGQEVAWCSKTGHGSRLVPAGALTGVQVLVTSKYIQWAGFIDQSKVDMNPSDFGGELDPHGADLRGNPIGGLVYSTAFAGDNTTYQQVNDWNTQVFIGGDAFCITLCNPSDSGSDQDAYCQNRYDRLGCAYNMPNNAQNGTFEVCDADLKTPVGVYVTNGVTATYTQPDTGVVSAPYTAAIPKSSNCVTYQSSALYTGLPTVTNAAASATGTAKVSGASSAGAAGATGAAANGAASLGVSAVAAILGTLFAVAFLS